MHWPQLIGLDFGWEIMERLSEWFEEFCTFHRKDGLIVKARDDLISASQYLKMMLRLAREPGQRWSTLSGPVVYSSKGIV
jgi:hypothetical protein